jgi:hypothetical protein
MPSLNALSVPVKNDFVRGIQDGRFIAPMFVGLLMGVANYFQKDIKSVVQTGGRPLGGDASFLMSTEYGSWDGSIETPSDVDLIETRVRKKNNLFDANFGTTALQYTNVVDKYDLNRYVGDPRMEGELVKYISDSAQKGLCDRIQADLFPYGASKGPVNLTDGNGGIVPGNRTNLPAIARFLGTGYTANATTGSGAYNIYKDRDFNQFPARAKAVNYGNGSTSVTLSWKNLMQYLIAPMKNRGAKQIVILVDTAAFSYLWDTVRDKTQLGMEMAKYWNGLSFGIANDIVVCCEPALDALPDNGFVREILALELSTWKFQFSDLQNASMNVHENIPLKPEIVGIDGYVECRYGCVDPGKNGHFYNVVIP